MIVWFSPTTIVLRAIGSCTLVISCHVVAPLDRDASTVVVETPLTPSATSLMAAGAAYTIAAVMAVKRSLDSSGAAPSPS